MSEAKWVYSSGRRRWEWETGRGLFYAHFVRGQGDGKWLLYFETFATRSNPLTFGPFNNLGEAQAKAEGMHT